MKVLILGGTKYLGRHIAEVALSQGIEVTLFNRGRTNPELFPQVTHLVGDRSTGDLAALDRGEWDGAIDLSAFFPSQVQALNKLRDRIGHYTFMSSIAVYADKRTPDQDEESLLRQWDRAAPEIWNMDSYGAFKVGCEYVAESVFPGRAAAVRSGFAVGAYGPDFGDWGMALAAGGTISCAVRPGQPIQLIDVRDLAAFLLHLSATGQSGAFNAVGPAMPLTFSGLLQEWHPSGPDTTIHWGAERDSIGVATDGSDNGAFQLSNARALAAGMRLRPVADTGRDYIGWIRGGGTPPPPPH